jgi:hypothetical protein
VRFAGRQALGRRWPVHRGEGGVVSIRYRNLDQLDDLAQRLDKKHYQGGLATPVRAEVASPIAT